MCEHYAVIMFWRLFIFTTWMQVFVANPNKPREIIQVLVDNHRELLKLLHNLPASKGTNLLPSSSLTLALFGDQAINASNRVTKYHNGNLMT